MNSFNFLELSSYAGLLATGVLTFNFLLGMMISTGYTKHNYWRRLPQKIKGHNLLKIHNWTASIALILVLMHPLILLFNAQIAFSTIDIFYPINVQHDKLMIIIGSISMYALVVILITTQKKIKKTMSFRTWKNIHLISYGMALLFLIHGIIIDPELKDRPVNLIDAEKLIPESCFLLIIIAAVIRYKYYLQNKNLQ